MRPVTAYALIETTRNGNEEIAIFDARVPVFWKRIIASNVNLERGGHFDIVQVTIRKRSKRKSAARKAA